MVLTPDERAEALLARRERIALARNDGAAFNEYVLRNEATNAPVKNAPHHIEWHELIEQHRLLVLFAHIESSKSASLSVGRALYELGRNPNLRIAIVSETDAKAMKLLRGIKTYLRESRELKTLFPHLKRSTRPGDPWNAHAITVEREVRARDPSIQVVGCGGSIIGARVDLLIMDDVLSHRTARTKAQQEKLLAWYQSNIAGRLTEDSRVIAINTAWTKNDLLHHLAKLHGWHSEKFGVIDPATGKPRWPEVWSEKRIAQARINLGPIEAARQLDCEPVEEGTSRFPPEALDRATKLGEEVFLAKSLTELLGGHELPEGCYLTTGVDVGASLRKTGALTVFFTALHYPNGDRQLVNIEAGRFSGPEILKHARSISARFNSLVFVENNGAQRFLLQFAEEGEHFPVLPFQTGANKWDPAWGVESLAVEAAQGRWIIPEHDAAGELDPEVQALLAEMRTYSPDAHSGDRLMSCLLPGQTVMTSRGPVPIEEVKVGDLVLTHRSRWRAVTGTTHRPYSGDIIDLRPAGMRALTVTSEHPIWACAPKQLLGKNWSRLVPDGAWDFIPAGDVRAGRKLAGDFVFSPVPEAWPDAAPTRIDLSAYVDTATKPRSGRWVVGDDTMAWRNEFTMPRWLEVDERAALLFGLYLAEGWIAAEHQVCFALHEDERDIHAFVAEEAARLFGATVGFDRRPGSRGLTVRINSTVAARLFADFGGRCDRKSLPWSWMGWPTPLLVAVVRGWFLGDGTMNLKRDDRRALKGVTVSRLWVEQMGAILRAARVPFAVCPFKQPGNFQGKPTKKPQRAAWMIGISAGDTAKLVRDALSVERSRWGEPDLSAIRERSNCRTMYVDGGAAVRVAQVNRRHYEGEVFNLHVHEDESYVAEGIAVHNCWIAREGARKMAPGMMGAGTVGVRIFAPVDRGSKQRRDWTDPIDLDD